MNKSENLTMDKICKNGDRACGSGYWICVKCQEEQNRRIYKQMTFGQKTDDNYVDPLQYNTQRFYFFVSTMGGLPTKIIFG